jgi:hypothetical protein
LSASLQVEKARVEAQSSHMGRADEPAELICGHLLGAQESEALRLNQIRHDPIFLEHAAQYRGAHLVWDQERS